MTVEKIKLCNVKKYGFNSKLHPESQIADIMVSIQEFGYNDPIAIDENNEIIEGHGRFEALKRLDFDEIEVIQLLHLTEKQKIAYRIAHNKLCKDTGFNAVKEELSKLNGEFAGFSMKEMEKLFEEKDDDYKQTKNLDNFFKADFSIDENEWGIPVTKPFTDNLEGIEWISFGEKCKINNPSNIGIHFYIDDYKFDSVWRTPNKWLGLFKQCRAVVTPDFSNYTDMPKVQQLWNHYRRQWLGKYWQENGVNVVSSISFGIDQIYDWCFAGIPANTTIATSFVGDAINKEKCIKDTKKAFEMVKPYKIFIKANRTDEKELKKHFNFGLIPPYEFKTKRVV